MFRVRRTPAAERHDTPQAEKYYSTPSTTPGDKMEHSLKKIVISQRDNVADCADKVFSYLSECMELQWMVGC